MTKTHLQSGHLRRHLPITSCCRSDDHAKLSDSERLTAWSKVLIKSSEDQLFKNSDSKYCLHVRFISTNLQAGLKVKQASAKRFYLSPRPIALTGIGNVRSANSSPDELLYYLPVVTVSGTARESNGSHHKYQTSAFHAALRSQLVGSQNDALSFLVIPLWTLR